MRRTNSGVFEALAFSAAVLVYIWVLRFRAPASVWLLVGWAVAAYFVHGDTLAVSGFSLGPLLRALADWRYLWPAALLGLALTLQERFADPQLLARGAVYFAWCCVQQTVYQNLIYRRIRDSAAHDEAPAKPPWLLAGMIFGIVHWPNPVLVPATAFWGAISSYLFERWPSVIALALVQFLFAALLYELTPWDWHHGFRIGPGYYSP